MTGSSRTALVLGASGGIGHAVSVRLFEAGYQVFAVASREAAGGAARDNRFFWLTCDLKNRESVGRMGESLRRQTDRLDLWVNCVAPPLKLERFDALSEEAWDEDVDVMLRGSLRALKETLPLLSTGTPAAVIALLSTALQDTPARMSSYIAAKAGLWGALKSVQVELRSSAIRIVGISPAFVETDLLKAFPSKLLEMERAKLEGGRFLSPADIANLVAAVADRSNRFPGGSHIMVRNPQELKELL